MNPTPDTYNLSLPELLERAGGNLTRAEEISGITRKTLRKRIRDLGLKAKAFLPEPPPHGCCDVCLKPVPRVHGSQPRTHDECFERGIQEARERGDTKTAAKLVNRRQMREAARRKQEAKCPQPVATGPCEYRAGCDAKSHHECAKRFEAAYLRVAEWLEEKELEARRQKRAAWRAEVAA